MASQLAGRLRQGTMAAHTQAENTAFMKCFLKGVVETEPFRQLMANFYVVYGALEAEMDRLREHPALKPIYFPEIQRRQNLAKDLAFYYGADWESQAQPTPGGLAYAQRLKELAQTQPELLIAHAYTRYLGDLSGGQGLRNVVRKALQLPEGQGTAFYEFEAIPTIEAKKAFKDKYRQALDAIEVPEDIALQIIEEANVAFRLNRQLTDELEGALRSALSAEDFARFTAKEAPGSTEPGNEKAMDNLVKA